MVGDICAYIDNVLVDVGKENEIGPPISHDNLDCVTYIQLHDYHPIKLKGSMSHHQ
jgi:hypothetical protein